MANGAKKSVSGPYRGGLKAPFPYFGGKRVVAPLVWQALGQPRHYIEPFFGSGAVLLARPEYQPGAHLETVNDADGHIANVWRSLQFAPEEVARWCDWPVNHADLAARKTAMVSNEGRLLEGLIADPEFYDAKLAGYWVWAASCWIGAGLTRLGQRPHVGHGGMGVHTLGTRPNVGNGGNGVHTLGLRQCLGNAEGAVTEPYNSNIYAWFRALSERLRYVRVVCGDWTRVCGGQWQDNYGEAGIFFDPPYSGGLGRAEGIYPKEDLTVAALVREWALERGAKPSYRIVLAGYCEEHESLLSHGWTVHQWKAQGGYGNISRNGKRNNRGKVNRYREALFFSPYCLGSRGKLF